ncbi:MAG: hypothetical protein EOO63_15320, partial [Hymenobacter sp.]
MRQHNRHAWSRIYSIAFHPSLPYFATGGQDKSIKIWDAENFKLYKILNIEKTGNGHTHSINKMQFAKSNLSTTIRSSSNSLPILSSRYTMPA